MEIKRNSFHILIENDGFAILHNGLEWLRLPVQTAVDADGKLDEDFSLLGPVLSEKDGIEFVTWNAVGGLWEQKEYILEIQPDAFRFHVKVFGKGKVDQIRYFCRADAVRYEIGTYCLPMAGPRGKEIKTVLDSSSIVLQYAVPPMYVYPFSVQDQPDVLGLGLVTEPGNYKFDVLKYDYPFRFTLPLYGKTLVNGAWEAQSIWGAFAEDDAGVFKAYTQWHYQTGLAKPHSKDIPDWWKRPIFCGWGEQAAYFYKDKSYGMQRYACCQPLYEKMMQKLQDEHLQPGSVIIDSKWQKAFGIWEPDPARWPDLRGFVEQQHKKGIKVMLWLKAWDNEGLPEDECIHWYCNPAGADPTNPKYIERLRRYVHTLLSDEEGCYNCDGFKIDFLNCVPYGEWAETHSGLCGVELIREWLRLVHGFAKEIKPDALISAFSAHPYFSELVDRPRAHDYDSRLRNCKSIMKWRSAIFLAANPDVPLDMDSGGIGSVRDFRSYMRYQAERGVPSLYWLNASGNRPLENVPFNSEDYDCIRDAWAAYEAKLSSAENR